MQITGKNNYSEGEAVRVSFRYTTEASGLAKTKALALKDKIYTGSGVRLGPDDLKDILYTGSKSSPTCLVYG